MAEAPAKTRGALREEWANYCAALRLRKLVYYPKATSAFIRGGAFWGLMFVFSGIFCYAKNLITEKVTGKAMDVYVNLRPGSAIIFFILSPFIHVILALLIMGTSFAQTLYILLYSNALAPVAEIFLAPARIARVARVRYGIDRKQRIFFYVGDGVTLAGDIFSIVLNLFCAVLQYKQILASLKEVRSRKGKQTGGLRKFLLFLVTFSISFYLRLGFLESWDPPSMLEEAVWNGYKIKFHYF